MEYIKSYLNTFKRAFVSFGLIFFIISLLQRDSKLAFLCLYYSFALGFVGPIGFALTSKEKVKVNA